MNRFLALSKEAGLAVKTLGNESEVMGKKMEKAGHRSFFMNQALFTLRRFAFHATVAVGAVGAAAMLMGFQFNQSMEAGTRAFTRFLGSPEAARKELDYLYNLARLTPFEFPQLTDATRKFLSFGFSIEESNALLTDLGDAIASFGGGTEEINRAVIALGQMRSTGRILGQDLRQLMQLGLIDPEDFRRRLNLPSDWQKSVGSFNISSKRGIDAITAYWRMKFGGAAEDFSKTMMGRLTTVRDDLRKSFGLMFLPMYNSIRDKILPGVDSVANAMATGFQTGGFHQAFVEVDKLGDGNGHLARTFSALMLILVPLKKVFWDFVDVLKATWSITKYLFAVFMLLVPILWAFHGILKLLKWPLAILISLYITERTILGVVIVAKQLYVFWTMAEWLWTKNAAIVTAIYTVWVLRAEYATLILTKLKKLLVFWTMAEWAWTKRATVGKYLYAAALWAVEIAMLALQIAIGLATGEMILLDAAMWANPIGLVVLAVIGLVAAFVILYWKVKVFRDLINMLWDTMKKVWKWSEDNPITKWGKYLIPGLNMAFAGYKVGSIVAGGAGDAMGAAKGVMVPSMPNAPAMSANGVGMTNKDMKALGLQPIVVQSILDGQLVAESVAETQLRMQNRG